MKEVKEPRKPLLYYYGIVLLIVLLFNLLVGPLLSQQQVVEVGYGTFMDMIDEGNIGLVQVEDTQIIFTDKERTTVYQTTPMEDPTLAQRLHEAGADFDRVLEQPVSPLLAFAMTYLLPILIFVGLGQYMRKKLMEQAGGGKNSMAFGMGKSNAKVYVQSTKGIRFSDVAGEDEAKENLSEVVDYLHNPDKYTEAGASMPKGILLVGPPRPWPEKPMYRSSPSPARNLWRCSWAWVPPRSGICSGRPRKRLPVLCSLTRSTPSARSAAPAAATAATTSGSRP